MLGPPKPRRLDASIAVSLEDLVFPCNSCPLKARGRTSRRGRRVRRSADEPYLDRGRGYHPTEACAFQLVEPISRSDRAI